MHLAEELLANVEGSGNFKKFSKGDESLADEECSAQPLEADNNN